MFSRALFKQSCKANWVMWTIVTLAICFMLLSLMLICGGGNISKIKNALSESIIREEIETQINQRSINYYNLASTSMDTFVGAYKSYYGTSNDVGKSYSAAQLKVLGDARIYLRDHNIDENSKQGAELLAVFLFATPTENFKPIYQKYDKKITTPEEMHELIMNNPQNIPSEVQRTISIFIGYEMDDPANKQMIIDQVKDYEITEEKYDSFGFTFEKVENMANTTIVTYNARLNYELSLIDPTLSEEEQALKRQEIVAELTGDLSDSLMADLPSSVSDGLEDLGQMSFFTLVIGSIYYKIAGLLLPIIYIIMVSNNLIASQVDSGSMAYVLSTSTKRKQVVFTQAIFLIGSIFLMCLALTITSLIGFSLISIKTELTYGRLILLNLGAFITLFAIAGFCFFTSCLFNRSKLSMSVGGGISMFFLVATMLGLFGTKILPSIMRLDSLNFFNYVSIISLFDTHSISIGSFGFIWKLAILLAIGLVGFIAGSRYFKRKDLPL